MQYLQPHGGRFLQGNDTKICTIECYLDTEDSEIYMRVPELNEGYIKMNMEEITQKAESEMEEEGVDSSFLTGVDMAGDTLDDSETPAA